MSQAACQYGRGSLIPRADLCLIGSIWLYSSRSGPGPKLQLARPTRFGPDPAVTQPQCPTLPLSSQEMIALGCSNFFGSFFKIHVICCALSVTLAVDGAGGKSQVSAYAGWMGVGWEETRTNAPENPRSQASKPGQLFLQPSSLLPSLHSTKGT